MLNETTISLVLFRWAVFCLLSYKCYQLIRQYAMPWLQEAIKDEQNLLSELVNKDKLAMIAKQKIENQLHSQSQLLTILEHNVQRWHTALLLEKARCEQIEQECANVQKMKHAEQQKHLFLAQSIAAIIPEALEQAETTLIQQHSNVAHFDRVITGLKAARNTP